MSESAVPNRTQIVRHGRRLEYFTVGWNALEGLVAVVAGAVAVLLALLWVRNDRPGAGWVYAFTISSIRVTTVALAIVALHNAVLLQALSGSA